MLDLLNGNVSERKLRLLAVAIARLLPHQLVGDVLAAVEMGERLADGLADPKARYDYVIRLDKRVADYHRPGGNRFRDKPPEERSAHYAAINEVGSWPTGR
ncbi:MAG: hypothetical protein JWO38_3786 [Gemmataceae bacterium]|nr:hypothetical protein [Gemmataceae bacterium]